MKKALSIILLVSMLMSMLLIPSFALSDEETNLVAGITSTWRWGTVNNSAGQKAKAKNMFDGVKSHSYCDGNQVICAQPQGYPTATYDINGLKASSPNLDEIKYTAIIGWPLPQGKAVVNTIRVYLNDIHEDGSSCKWMPDAFDIAVSPTGDAGSWQVVYSEDNIRCEEKFEVYEEGGKKTAYVEATFPATEVSHFAIALRVARCPHMEDSAAVTNKVGKATMRITEIEVMGYPAFNPSKYTNLLTGAAVESYQFPTAAGLKNATDGVISHNHNDGSTFLGLATPTYTKNGIYDINGNAGSSYVGYVTYEMRAAAEIEAVRVYLDEIVQLLPCALSLDDSGSAEGKACERMLDGMDIAISSTGKTGSWKIVYSENNINAEQKYQVYTDNEGNQTAFVEALFDPTQAKYVRIGITDTGCEERTQNEDDLRSCRITEIQAWAAGDIPLDGEVVEESGVNSLMLFPLLMRHRQYETETSTTMFGLRVKHLLRSADAITFEKNGVKVDLPAATLKALNLAGSDKLVVTIDGTDAENAKVTVTVNGKAVDIEGISSATPVEPEEEKGTTYRWDFDDLNEKNGLNNLTDSAASTKAYKFEDGMIVIDDRTTDFKMAEAISLSPYTDWSIEWRAQLNNASALFGTEASKQNFVYIAYTVSGWGLPFRMVDSNNKALMIKQGDYAPRNTEMNTWKAEYSSAENKLTLKFFNEESQEWEVVGAGTPPSFSFELTHMFGRYDPETNVCLNGKVDYVEVFIGE